MPRASMHRLPTGRLLALGAGAFDHVNGSLAQHLQGTEALLRHWGNREALCLAGLYHAVYGTAGIRGCLVGIDRRAAIAEVIGSEAEHVAYLYGACAREAFHPRIGTSEQLRFADRFTRTEYSIPDSSLRDFCELTLANELELAIRGATFRFKHRTELVAVVARMRGLVSDAGVRAHRRLLGDVRGDVRDDVLGAVRSECERR